MNNIIRATSRLTFGALLQDHAPLQMITLKRLTHDSTEAHLPQPIRHEPEYLEEMKPKVGYYDLLNLKLKGYDYVILEKYQSYLHKTMKKMNFKVVDAWSIPHQDFQLDALGDKSNYVEASNKIKIYGRNIQIKEALVTKLPILIDIINMTSPPGVSFSIDRHSKADEDSLYIRDSVLEQLKEELQELKDTPLIGA